MTSLSAFTDALRNAGRRFFWGDAAQSPTEGSYDVDMGIGQQWQHLGAVPEWMRRHIEDARMIRPDQITYHNAKAEAARAGEWSGSAVIHADIVKSRRQAMQAMATIIKGQMQLDGAAFSTSSQIAATQAQNLKSMAKQNFTNGTLSANTGAFVSTLRGSRQRFTIGGN